MENEPYIINLVIIFVKFRIHRCKFKNQKPLFFRGFERSRTLYGFY